MQLLFRWLIATLAIIIAAYLLPGVHVAGVFAALVVAIVVGLINALIRPLILILTLPLNILTFGLLTFVINAFMIMLAARIVEGFAVDSFWWALLFSIVLTLVGSILKGAAEPEHKTNI